MSQAVSRGAFAAWFSKRALAVLAVLGALSGLPSYAQLSTASVTGIVRDSSGSAVPNVKITLQNTGTSVQHVTQSNSAGNYVFLNITPGPYTLEATAPNFQVTRIPQFNLAVNQTATLDITLQVGTVQQSVTVEATGELV